MKYASLILLFLISCNWSYSQEYPDSNSYCNYTVYYDYTMCLKGIKDESDSVVLSPRFEEIQILPGDLLLVKDAENYGVINCDFDTLLPIVYKQLQMSSKYYQTPKIGKNYFWLFESTSGSGVMSSSLDTIIPPKFDHLERLHVENIHKMRNSRHYEHPYYLNYYRILNDAKVYFKVELNSLTGVYDEFGKEIATPKYAKLVPQTLFGNTRTPFIPDGIYIIASNQYGTDLISGEGKLLVDAPTGAEFEVYGIDSSTIVFTRTWSDSVRISNLELNKHLPYTSGQPSYMGSLIFDFSVAEGNTVYNHLLETVYTNNHRHSLYALPMFLGSEVYNHVYSVQSTPNSVLLSADGELLIETKNKSIATIQNEEEGLIWSYPERVTNGLDTLSIYYSNGEVKDVHLISGINYGSFFQTPYWSDPPSDPFLFIRKKGKWGAIDHKGERVIKYQYDLAGEKQLGPYHNYYHDEVTIGYYLKKQNKYGFVDTAGHFEFECKYDTIIHSYAGEYTLVGKKHSYSLMKGKETLLSSCDTIFCDDYLQLRYPRQLNQQAMIRGKYKFQYPFGIKNGKLITSTDSTERVCDSSLLFYKNQVNLIGNVFVDVDGSVLHQFSSGSIHKTNHFYLHIAGNQAQVYLFSGAKGLFISNFKSAQVENDFVKIKLLDETVGVISIDGNKWLYHPQYYDITFACKSAQYAWAKKDTLLTETSYGHKYLKSYAGNWRLVDTSLNERYDIHFEYPAITYLTGIETFWTGNKMGLIDSSANLLIPPDYDWISSIQKSSYYILLSGNKYQLGHASGSVHPMQFDLIYDNAFSNNIIVADFVDKDTMIGILTYADKFNWILPLTQLDDVRKKTSLSQLLNILEVKRSRSISLLLHKDVPDVWFELDNAILLHYIFNIGNYYQQMNKTIDFFTDFELGKPRLYTGQQFFPSITYNNRTQQIRELIQYPRPIEYVHYPMYKSVVYRSEQIYTIHSKDGYSFSFENYINLNGIRKVSLADLLIKDERTNQFFKKYIQDYYNAKKADGHHCPDYEKIKDLMWTDFSFKDGAIAFNSVAIIIPYEELEPYFTPLCKQLKPW